MRCFQLSFIGEAATATAYVAAAVTIPRNFPTYAGASPGGGGVSSIDGANLTAAALLFFPFALFFLELLEGAAGEAVPSDDMVRS